MEFKSTSLYVEVFFLTPFSMIENSKIPNAYTFGGYLSSLFLLEKVMKFDEKER